MSVLVDNSVTLTRINVDVIDNNAPLINVGAGNAAVVAFDGHADVTLVGIVPAA